MSKENINEEAKKLKALAGIQEGDKKFLNNESFSDGKFEVGKNNPTIHPDNWKELDGMFIGHNSISQEKLDAVTKLMEDTAKTEAENYITIKFEQENVELCQDDETLYKIS